LESKLEIESRLVLESWSLRVEARELELKRKLDLESWELESWS
jgi:hypothetical protein